MVSEQTTKQIYKVTKNIVRNGTWKAMKPKFYSMKNSEDSLLEYYASKDSREYGVAWTLDIEIIEVPA
jgi:ASC-1-like (ASCH) protein